MPHWSEVSSRKNASRYHLPVSLGVLTVTGLEETARPLKHAAQLGSVGNGQERLQAVVGIGFDFLIFLFNKARGTWWGGPLR